jgi:hypothetical protein
MPLAAECRRAHDKNPTQRAARLQLTQDVARLNSFPETDLVGDKQPVSRRVQKLKQRLELVRMEQRPRGAKGVQSVLEWLLKLAESDALRKHFAVSEVPFCKKRVQVTLDLVRFEIALGKRLPLAAEYDDVPVFLPKSARILPDDAEAVPLAADANLIAAAELWRWGGHRLTPRTQDSSWPLAALARPIAILGLYTRPKLHARQDEPEATLARLASAKA